MFYTTGKGNLIQGNNYIKKKIYQLKFQVENKQLNFIFKVQGRR